VFYRRWAVVLQEEGMFYRTWAVCSTKRGRCVFYETWAACSTGSGSYSVHEGELLGHHDGVEGQEGECWQLVLETALLLRGEGTANVLRCGTTQKT